MKKTMHTWLLWLFAAAAAIVLNCGTVRAEGAVRITVPVKYGLRYRSPRPGKSGEEPSCPG